VLKTDEIIAKLMDILDVISFSFLHFFMFGGLEFFGRVVLVCFKISNSASLN